MAKIEIISQKLRHLTDEEILLAEAWRKNESQLNLSPSLMKVVGIGGLGVAYSALCRNPDQQIGRRDFFKTALGATAAGALILGSDEDAEAFWGALIGVVVGAVIGVGSLLVGCALASGSSRSGGGGGSYGSTEYSNVAWNRKEGGNVRSSLMNNTDAPQSGYLNSGVIGCH